MEQVLNELEAVWQKERARNRRESGMEYLEFSDSANTWNFSSGEGYLDSVRKIPFEYFLTVELCEIQGAGRLPAAAPGEKYRLATYSPCTLPVEKKVNLIESDHEENNLHRHDYYEIIYVHSGYRTMQIEDQTVVLQEHDLCIFDTQCAHLDVRLRSGGIAFYCCVKGNNLDNYVLSRLTDRKIREFFLVKGQLLSDVSYLHLHADPASSEVIQKNLAVIFREMETEAAGYERAVQVCILRILNSFSASKETDLHTFSKRLRGDKLFQAVARYINSNIADISLDKLCQEFHYQSDYYSRLIKKNTGMTYSQYVHELKMDKARNLLMNTEMTVNEIMIFLGYDSPSCFYDSFRKKTGMTPQQYRRNSPANR